MKINRLRSNLIKLLTVLVVALSFYSCSDENGTIGPQGDSGEQGAKGDQGEKGELGTANVIYSGWIDANYPAEIKRKDFKIEIKEPKLTDDIINSGVVLVYAKGKFDQVYGVPFTIFDFGRQAYVFVTVLGSDELTIWVSSLDPLKDIGVPIIEQYRYILIPGGVPAAARQANLDFKNMTYQEVLEVLDIPD